MRRTVAAVATVLIAAACGPSAPAMEGTPYGEPLTLTDVTPVSTIAASPTEHVGKRVLIEGTVVAVCEMRGCWIDIASDRAYEKIQVKVDDGVITFPLSAIGHTALVEGVVEELQLTHEEAVAAAEMHAKERGETFDPATVTGPETIYRIRGIGAVIRDGAAGD